MMNDEVKTNQEGFVSVDENVSRGPSLGIAGAKSRFTELKDEIRVIATDDADSVDLRGDENGFPVFDRDLLSFRKDDDV